MAQELQPAAAPLVPVATGEVVDPHGLVAVAAEVAARPAWFPAERFYVDEGRL
jgi:hypothetical protein